MLDASALVELLGPRTEVAAAPGRALVVLDASVEGGDQLAGSFADAAATVVIRPGDDPFASVGEDLQSLGDVSAIHLVSHGSPGRFSLGDISFDAAGIDEWAGGLIAWNRLAGPGADLYLWGCDVAGGDGASLIDSIHHVSGFGVAASTDLTGPARLGGDFDLEYSVGDVATPALVAGVDVLWDTTLAASITASAGKGAHTVLGAATVVDADITVTGVSAATITVTIGTTGAARGDTLDVPATLTGVTTAYTATFDATTWALTIKATTGTFSNAEIQRLFRAVTFTGGAARGAGDVGITFAAGGASATKTITVTPYTLTATQRTNLTAAFTTIESQIAEQIKSETTAGRGNSTDLPPLMEPVSITRVDLPRDRPCPLAEA